MSHPNFLKNTLSPQDELFLGMPEPLAPMAWDLLGLLPVPPEQPRIANVIFTLCSSLIAFSREHPFYAIANPEQIKAAQLLAEFAKPKMHGDSTPLVQLIGRQTKYVEWVLCTELSPVQSEIAIPLGTEVALALAEQRQLRNHLIRHLRRDLELVPRNGAADAQSKADLAAQDFGHRWRATIRNGERALAKRCAPALAASNQGPSLSEVAEEHLSHITGKAGNGTAKARAGISNHREASLPQMIAYGMELRDRLFRSQVGSITEAISLFTGLDHRGVLGLAFGNSPRPGEILTIDLDRGGLHVAFDRLLERKTTTSVATTLYEPTRSSYLVPWPSELLDALKDRLEQHASSSGECMRDDQSALRVVDVLSQPDRDHAADPGESALTRVPADAHGFTPTVARLRNALPTLAMDAKVPRAFVASARLDFQRVGRARPWYLRVEQADFSLRWRALLGALGWSTNARPTAEPEAFGSPLVLCDKALQEIWSIVAGRVMFHDKGPNMTLKSCESLHNAYATFVGMALSFLLGLRERDQYDLYADAFTPDVEVIPFDDKKDPTKSGDRYVVLNRTVSSLLADWLAHCEALLRRYLGHPVASRTRRDTEVISHLQSVVHQQHVHLLFRIAPRGVVSIGSAKVWNELPALQRCVPNAGRHYWATHFHKNGCSDAALNLFMRHMTAGDSPTSSVNTASLGKLAREISALQERQIGRLKLAFPAGLRKST